MNKAQHLLIDSDLEQNDFNLENDFKSDNESVFSLENVTVNNNKKENVC